MEELLAYLDTLEHEHPLRGVRQADLQTTKHYVPDINVGDRCFFYTQKQKGLISPHKKCVRIMQTHHIYIISSVAYGNILSFLSYSLVSRTDYPLACDQLLETVSTPAGHS